MREKHVDFTSLSCDEEACQSFKTIVLLESFDYLFCDVIIPLELM